MTALLIMMTAVLIIVTALLIRGGGMWYCWCWQCGWFWRCCKEEDSIDYQGGCDTDGNTWVADQVTVVDNWDKAAYRQNDNDRSIWQNHCMYKIIIIIISVLQINFGWSRLSQSGRFPCLVLLVLSWNTTTIENPNTDKLSLQGNQGNQLFTEQQKVLSWLQPHLLWYLQ